MRTKNTFNLLILIIIQSCSPAIYVNKLEQNFAKEVTRKEHVKKVTLYNDNSKNDTNSYYNGYDIENKIITKANREFFIYDSLGRIRTKYVCVLERDPECNKPYIYNFQYSKNKLISINYINQFSNDTTQYESETFQYDNLGRLIEHTEFSDDTTKYYYIGTDTLIKEELSINWCEPFGKKIKVERKTTYIYDNLGRKESSTWVEPLSNLSSRIDYTYDEKNRIIIERDTSLENSTVHQPNSCCVLNWKEFKYDKHNRVIEVIYSNARFDDNKKMLQRKVIYEY